ncbi:MULTISPECIES: arginase [Lysobacter]|uniref:Arginase n=1 Tax=Lysobacter yananisis TaxID=1003114 RepID=A0ABY9P3K6_9GAMM|nr:MULTISPECIES: arginase [Lysobacter]QQQ03171.1 arginase [Lysobacter enzymogenes]UZW62650.1 arginase [Lysobacter enzymogenes]WMT01580.1 arginase [Lysobacter yananisis]
MSSPTASPVSALPVSLIGAPTDVGAGDRGARLGPEALRIAGLREALHGLGLDVADRGNLDGPPNPWTGPVDGYRHLDEVIAWNRQVMNAVSAELGLGRMPILLGGDHCLGLGSITAVAQHCRAHGKKLRVLWLDAHADFNTNDITPSGNLHGMPVACLIGLGPRELTHLGGEAPAMQAGQMRQIGTRSVDAGEKQLIRRHGLPVYDMRRIGDLGIKRVMEDALADLDEDTHLHVSFDVDFLDPTIAPGVGTGVAGGPNYREAQLAMEMIAESGRMGSLDIVELNPILDRDNATALIAIDLVESLFGKSTLVRD